MLLKSRLWWHFGHFWVQENEISFLFWIFRCVQLIEPSLNSSEAKHIEQLITIYMDLNPSNSTNNSKLCSNDVVIHTLDDCLKDGPVDKMVTEVKQNGKSIWREAPGWWYSYSFYLISKKKFHEN